jgi:hypothetical protein
VSSSVPSTAMGAMSDAPEPCSQRELR